MWNFIVAIVIGGAAGWLASQFYKGKSSGMLLNILLGIGGGLVGKFLFGILGFGITSVIGTLVSSVVGALVLIWGYKQLTK